jgi:IclR family mhp operon transcriptional activator
MPVRALSRGLLILQRLTSCDGLSANELARQLKLPRGTCHRLLRTLEGDGYVRFSPSDGRWRTTQLAQGLGRAEDWESWVGEIATPLIEQFTAQHIWPLVVSTLHGTHMIVRASSDRNSPLALHRYRRGFLITLTGTSAGRVFLAYCEPGIRRALIDMLQTDAHSAHSWRFLANLEDEVRLIREQGFATSPLVFQGEAAIAAPILADGGAVGAVSLRYIAAAKKSQDMATQFLPELQRIAAQIGEAMARGQRGS